MHRHIASFHYAHMRTPNIQHSTFSLFIPVHKFYSLSSNVVNYVYERQQQWQEEAGKKVDNICYTTWHTHTHSTESNIEQLTWYIGTHDIHFFAFRFLSLLAFNVLQVAPHQSIRANKCGCACACACVRVWVRISLVNIELWDAMARKKWLEMNAKVNAKMCLSEEMKNHEKKDQTLFHKIHLMQLASIEHTCTLHTFTECILCFASPAIEQHNVHFASSNDEVLATLCSSHVRRNRIHNRKRYKIK